MYAGSAYIISEASVNIIRTLISPGLETGGYFGASVAWVPDASGDGGSEIAVVGQYPINGFVLDTSQILTSELDTNQALGAIARETGDRVGAAYAAGPQALVEAARQAGALTFVAHPFERDLPLFNPDLEAAGGLVDAGHPDQGVEEVDPRDDPDDPPVVDDGEAPDLPLAHDPRGVFNGVLRVRRQRVAAHDRRDRAVRGERHGGERRGREPQVPVGDDADEAVPLEDRQVPERLLPHRPVGVLERGVGRHRHHRRSHDVSNEHGPASLPAPPSGPEP